MQQQVYGSGSANAPGAQPAPFYITSTNETEDLKRFLATAPQLWTKADDPPIRSYQLSNGENISCIFWRGKFFVTGTDIVKVLIFRFAQAGRPVLNAKKFEEGIFSDLRNLKAGTEAILEEPKSEFLDFLFRHGCIRTQKKQKVFFWHCVPHESLFLDAIERDFKREGSLYHMNMMMNHTRYLQKQVAMMQASAIQQQFTTNPTTSSVTAMPPAPQLMPNVSRSASFSGQTGASTSSLYPQPGQYTQNASDPFLMTASMRHPTGKINLNAASMLVAPTPMKTAISRLHANSSDSMMQPGNFPNSFDFGSEFDPSAVNFSDVTDDALLSDYLMSQTGVNIGNENTDSSGFVDPSILTLHEY